MKKAGKRKVPPPRTPSVNDQLGQLRRQIKDIRKLVIAFKPLSLSITMPKRLNCIHQRDGETMTLTSQDYL